MAHLYKDLGTDSAYVDKKPMIGMPELERHEYEKKYRKALEDSNSVYVGNLAFAASEEALHDLFSSVGVVKDIIMGLDRVTKTPCGFCFIEYNTHREAEDAKRYLNGRHLCNRPIRVDWDKGNVRKENRYWGRGATGGQVRDEYRSDYDPARGGLGVRTLESLGGQFVRPEARVYGNWAYTPFNVHQKRSTAARKLPDMDQSYEEMAEAGRKRRRDD